MNIDKLKDYRVFLALAVVAIYVLYPSIMGHIDRKILEENAIKIAEEKEGSSSLVYFYPFDTHVNIHIKISGIPRDSDIYKNEKNLYVQSAKDFVCSSQPLKKYINEGKPIMVDLLRSNQAGDRFADIKVLRGSCA